MYACTCAYLYVCRLASIDHNVSEMHVYSYAHVHVCMWVPDVISVRMFQSMLICMKFMVKAHAIPEWIAHKFGVCIYVCMYVCVYVSCMYVRIYVLCMYVCMYACMYV